ncbi:uncharacterized protein LOC132363516 [Balaenoptera ricei]|uniref:uncharacterized protein LOC132363516 n=1 Tax=Balaenoptera ricei TaxID=2746895 RepID=UPI0028BE88F8|nr:uncharacterized protein LOC132363516 [Balaenoptera ricei]XP_059775191.1 uncharacterized protein LOC132363516 [Balaenoptera ricei]XP_059775192.1 uncharacterized protein LOC132363516 [Balaenoptera ricei]XP_059775193.1 uncharacterized protein LOC132363516 [Balaenoptera ricei]
MCRGSTRWLGARPPATVAWIRWNCVSGHRGERSAAPRAARPPLSESRDLDASLTGVEGVQACGASASGRTLGFCGFQLPSELDLKRRAGTQGQPVADAFGTSRRGHARFKKLWFPGGQALGNGRNARGLGLRALPGKRRRRRPWRPPPPSWGSREPGRLSGDAARSRARGRRGGAVARGCRLVPAAVAPALSPATDGRRESRTCLLPRRFDSGKKDNNTGAFQ